MKKIAMVFLLAAMFPAAAQAEDEFLRAMDLGNAGHIREARQILWRLADRGDCDAQAKLAALLMYGQGGQPDPGAAIYKLEQASAQGEPTAQMTMGDLYFNEPGATNLSCAIEACPAEFPVRDYAEAYKWYLLAGERVYARRDKEYVANAIALLETKMNEMQKQEGAARAASWAPEPAQCDFRRYHGD